MGKTEREVSAATIPVVASLQCVANFDSSLVIKEGLDSTLPKAVKALKPERMLWISFPKGSSKIQTDLTRDKGWETLSKVDLKWITLISVNETWSAFALRPYRSGEPKQKFRL